MGRPSGTVRPVGLNDWGTPLINHSGAGATRVQAPPHARSPLLSSRCCRPLGRPDSGPTETSLTPLPIKRTPVVERNHFSSPFLPATKALCHHRSSIVSHRSNWPILDSFGSYNPLELMVLLRSVLQPKTHPSEPYIGSHH
jgi:hypothetical protein